LTRSTARTRSRPLGTTCVLIVGLVSVWIGGAAGQVQVARPEDIKATFLYNFARFVEWPASSGGDRLSRFRIEIIGRDPFDGRFDQLMIGKKMNDQPIEVVHSLGDPSPMPVQIAFVAASEGKRLDSLLSAYSRNRVLTVSDIPDFTQRGGMIGFTTELGAVRFRINLVAVEQSRLRVSSRLLALGR
jgi:hypothetical protein